MISRFDLMLWTFTAFYSSEKRL